MSLSPVEGSRILPVPAAVDSSPREPDVAAGARATGEEMPSPFARLLKMVGTELDRGERTTQKAIAAAHRGVDPSPAELIALQSQIYRYTEVVDLAAKLVDRASNGVKTVVQGQ